MPAEIPTTIGGGGGPGIPYTRAVRIDPRTGLEFGSERWLLTEILSELKAIHDTLKKSETNAR